MSFLKSFRNSVSRKSSSNSRSGLMRIGPDSDISRKSCSDFRGILKQQNEQPEGLSRSDTFTIHDEDSILVVAKRSAKQSMFGKFSTFTRKKKLPSQRHEEFSSKESNLSNSYKRWPTPSDPVTTSNDPFGVLYSQNSPSLSSKSSHTKRSSEKSSIDYGTYRKNKLPNAVKEQLQEIKSDPKVKITHSEVTDDSERFRTITINSLRKSFRKKFLTQQKEVPHNPAWFIEVEPPKENKDNDKKPRPELIVYENENFSPTSRSPIRGLESQKPEKSSYRASKSPIRGMESQQKQQRTTVKRNETFRVEPEHEPSIRIEIKNSITPNEPGRMVPVGVAKPMQSNRSNITQRTWVEEGEGPASQQNLYQTTIHINNNNDRDIYHSKGPRRVNGNSSFQRNYNPSHPAKAQLRDSGRYRQSERPISYISNYSPLTSYEMLSKIRKGTDPSISVYNGETRQKLPIQSHSQSQPWFREDGNVLYENRRWAPNPSASTFSSRQKLMIDQAIRKENPNRIPTAVPRKSSNRVPWR